MILITRSLTPESPIFGILPPKQTYQTAKDTARRAIEIDGKLAEAHAALGFAELCGDYDWRTSEKNIRRAIEINPNYAVARNWLAIHLFTAGRFDEGIEHAKKAIELDPLTYQNHRTLSWGYYFSRRFEESLEVINRTIEKFPLTGTALANRSWLLRSMGKTEAALRDSRKSLETAGGNLFVLLGHAQALAADGKLAEAEKLIEEIKANPATKYVSYYQVALAYCYAGQIEKACAALERAFEDRDGWLVWLGVEPALDVLREDARFHTLLVKINHPLTPLPKPLEQNKIIPSEAETIVQTRETERSLPASLKYILAAIIAVVIVFVLYEFFSR